MGREQAIDIVAYRPEPAGRCVDRNCSKADAERRSAGL